MPSFLHRTNSLRSQPLSTYTRPEPDFISETRRSSSPRPRSTISFSSKIPLWKSSLSSLASSHKSKALTLPSSRSAFPKNDNTPPTDSFGNAVKIDKSTLQKYISPHKSPPTPIRKDSPRIMKIHQDWRSAAKNLKGISKNSLEGAICLRVFDPLEGVHDKLIQAYAPRKTDKRLVASNLNSSVTSPSPSPFPSPYMSSPSSSKAIRLSPRKHQNTPSRIPVPPTSPLLAENNVTPRSPARLNSRSQVTPIRPLRSPKEQVQQRSFTSCELLNTPDPSSSLVSTLAAPSPTPTTSKSPSLPTTPRTPNKTEGRYIDWDLIKPSPGFMRPHEGFKPDDSWIKRSSR